MTDKDIVVTIRRPSVPWCSTPVLMDQLVQNACGAYGKATSEDNLHVSEYHALYEALPPAVSYTEDGPAQLLVLIIDDQSDEIFRQSERLAAFAEKNCIVLVATTWVMGRRAYAEFLRRNEINRQKGQPGRISVVLKDNLVNIGNNWTVARTLVNEWLLAIGAPAL